MTPTWALALALLAPMPQGTAGEHASQTDPQYGAAVCPPVTQAQLARPVPFAPPAGQPMHYLVRLERLNRHGVMEPVSFHYELTWSRLGRGWQAVSALTEVSSDSDSAYARLSRRHMQPLIGQSIVYSINPANGDVAVLDGSAQWDRILKRALASAMQQGSHPSAMMLGNSLLAMPPEQRDKLVTADIALLLHRVGQPVAAEGPELIPIGGPSCNHIRLHSTSRIDAKAETSWGDGAAGPPMPAMPAIITHRQVTLDLYSGLVVDEVEQSWSQTDDQQPPRLISRRLRQLRPLSPPNAP